jgi:cell division protein FtsW (lipid II flippase)
VGVPLIFVSHGGTALAMALAEAGVILSVSRRMKH